MNPIDNAIVLAEAKKYSDSKGGYTKPGKTLAFDISGATEEDFLFGGYVKISAEAVDLTKVTRMTSDQGEEVLTFTDFTVGVSEDLANIVEHSALIVEGTAFVLTIAQSEARGTYAVVDLHKGTIEFAETIVPIDPKFLPGVCLPIMIELSVILSDYTGDIVDVPKEEGDQIMEAFQNGTSNIWITAKNKAGAEYLCRLSSLRGTDSEIEFVFDAGQFKYSIAYVNGGWKMALGATNP